MARKVVVGGSEVRAWLKAQGKPVGERGRLSAEQVDAFQSATGQKYEVGHKAKREIQGVRVNPTTGRKTPVRVKATLTDVRAWARSPEGATALGGLSVGERGRISAPVLSAFAGRPKA